MHDRLGTARALLVAAAAVTLLALCLPAVGSAWLARGVDPNPALISALRLSGPALHPAGTPGRQPETVAPGVDLHTDPTLVRFPMDDGGLLLPAARPASVEPRPRDVR